MFVLCVEVIQLSMYASMCLYVVVDRRFALVMFLFRP